MKRMLPYLLCLCMLLTGCGFPSVPREREGDPAVLYDKLLATLQTGADTVTLEGSWSEEQLATAYGRVRNEHPELFWLGASWTGSVESSLLKTTVTLKPSCYGTAEENQKKRRELEQAAEALLEKAKAQPSLYEQVLFVHDALAEAADYDWDSAERVGQLTGGEVLLASTAYGCLVEKKAICTGYAAAFHYMMNLLRVPCLRVTGRADGELHEWNLITLEGESYHVDLTWDDPAGQEGEKRVSHDYFCISDEELRLTHTVDAGQELPACPRARSWYGFKGYSTDRFELGAVAEILRRQAEAGQKALFVQFTQEPSLQVEELVKPEHLQALANELQLSWKGYRINRAENAVELIWNEGEN